jgi:hypothetical protein
MRASIISKVLADTIFAFTKHAPELIFPLIWLGVICLYYQRSKSIWECGDVFEKTHWRVNFAACMFQLTLFTFRERKRLLKVLHTTTRRQRVCFMRICIQMPRLLKYSRNCRKQLSRTKAGKMFCYSLTYRRSPSFLRTSA